MVMVFTILAIVPNLLSETGVDGAFVVYEQ